MIVIDCKWLPKAQLVYSGCTVTGDPDSETESGLSEDQRAEGHTKHEIRPGRNEHV